jgi:hypothetical protein
VSARKKVTLIARGKSEGYKIDCPLCRKVSFSDGQNRVGVSELDVVQNVSARGPLKGTAPQTVSGGRAQRRARAQQGEERATVRRGKAPRKFHGSFPGLDPCGSIICVHKLFFAVREVRYETPEMGTI